MLRHTGSRISAAVLSVLALAAAPKPALGQSPTGTISGHITSTDGQPVPTATVTIESPSLQQPETRTTSENGDYLFKFLLPGTYTLTVRHAGFAPATEVRTVSAAEPAVIDLTLKVQAVNVEATVTAPEPTDAFVNTSLAASTFRQALLDSLPTTRTVLAAVNLAPGVHDTGPSPSTTTEQTGAPSGSFTINGAMTYENVYQINGVQTQDNLRGTPLPLYIEDAVQETTVMTSGLSAEYGRFGGGVINTITKSGGNQFSASYRTTFTNDDWRTVSPYGEPEIDQTVPETEFTVGGPVVRDRTWFFGAGRVVDNSQAEETTFTNIPYTFTTNEDRFEGKVTQAFGPSQRLEVDEIGIHDRLSNFNNGQVMDTASLVNADEPQNLVAVHYTGSFGSRFFLESQFSARQLAFQHDGGMSTDPVQGTTLLDQQTGATWWAPQFCGVCGDEDRDNSNFVVKGTYYLSTGAGAHNIVFGSDTFNDHVKNDNHQSGSDWTIWTTTSQIENGTVYPVVSGGPDGDSTYLINWPIAEASEGTNFRTYGFFVNDAWTINHHLSASLGVRYDKNHGVDSAGALIANDAIVSPRLGFVWDPTGTGRTTVDVNAGRYVDALANNIANETSPAGLPSILAYFYQGPDINTDASQPLVSSADAIQQMFAWYNAAQPAPFQATVPGVTTEVQGSLKSPHSDEVSVGISRLIGTRGAVRADFVDRRYGDFYAVRTDTTTGQVTDDLGNVYDLGVLENTNALTRRYKALDVEASYRAGTALTLGASYTLSSLVGNFEGEDLDSGPLAADMLSYPEYFNLAWSDPVGNLSADQRNRGRAWATVVLPWFDKLVTLGAIESAQSGTPYGAVGTIDTSAYVTNPGYVTPPVAAVPYYFTARDAFHTAAMYRTDLSVELSRKLAGRGPQIFAQFQVLNLFNQFQLFDAAGNAINETVLTAVNDPGQYQPFNPFTETPVQGVNWDYGSKFGQPTDKTAYTLPRTFTFSLGVRF